MRSVVDIASVVLAAMAVFGFGALAMVLFGSAALILSAVLLGVGCVILAAAFLWDLLNGPPSGPSPSSPGREIGLDTPAAKDVGEVSPTSGLRNLRNFGRTRDRLCRGGLMDRPHLPAGNGLESKVSERQSQGDFKMRKIVDVAGVLLAATWVFGSAAMLLFGPVALAGSAVVGGVCCLIRSAVLLYDLLRGFWPPSGPAGGAPGRSIVVDTAMPETGGEIALVRNERNYDPVSECLSMGGGLPRPEVRKGLKRKFSGPRSQGDLMRNIVHIAGVVLAATLVFGSAAMVLFGPVALTVSAIVGGVCCVIRIAALLYDVLSGFWPPSGPATRTPSRAAVRDSVDSHHLRDETGRSDAVSSAHDWLGDETGENSEDILQAASARRNLLDGSREPLIFPMDVDDLDRARSATLRRAVKRPGSHAQRFSAGTGMKS